MQHPPTIDDVPQSHPSRAPPRHRPPSDPPPHCGPSLQWDPGTHRQTAPQTRTRHPRHPIRVEPGNVGDQGVSVGSGDGVKKFRTTRVKKKTNKRKKEKKGASPTGAAQWFGRHWSA